MSEKVKLPREVAEAIKELRLAGYTNIEIICETKIGSHPKWNELVNFVERQTVNYDLLLQSLVNGYEVEQTPEDKVREYYQRLQEEIAAYPTALIWNKENEIEKNAITNTLDMLGIKISGVNAE